MQRLPGFLPPIPPPADQRIAVRVTAAAERALKRGHPWLFSEAITHQNHEGKPGDLAVVFDRKRKFLAIGLYDPNSTIRVRVLQFRKPTPINSAWFANRISMAVKIREGLPVNNNAYRLLHGENDQLPGIVIDRYDQSLVIKIYTSAWIPHLATLVPIIIDLINPDRIILRLSRDLKRFPEYLFKLNDGFLIYGKPATKPILFCENGIIFEADLVKGQKTGFFLDQRHNRARVEKLSQGKRVLNVFAYTGGFSVYAARGGAKEVISLDLSKPALETAKRNFAHNQIHPGVASCKHEVMQGDAFEVLQRFARKRMNFDIVILDPPSFAKKKTEIKKALKAYQQLTRLGLAVLNEGGNLVQASCSSRISAPVFYDTVHQAARVSGYSLTEIERTGHGLDHPVVFPEGEYLKCLFARTSSIRDV